MAMFAPKNILVPTDFSKYSDAALKKAVEIATQFKAKIYLLHVFDENIQQCAVDYCLDVGVYNQLVKDSMTAAKEKLKKQTDAVAKKQDVAITSDVKKGNPPEVILSEQKAKKADLIVISSHGKTGILEQLMGSVARKVTEGAKCPVVVVKP
jgi:universal stress protein A